MIKLPGTGAAKDNHLKDSVPDGPGVDTLGLIPEGFLALPLVLLFLGGIHELVVDLPNRPEHLRDLFILLLRGISAVLANEEIQGQTLYEEDGGGWRREGRPCKRDVSQGVWYKKGTTLLSPSSPRRSMGQVVQPSVLKEIIRTTMGSENQPVVLVVKQRV